MSSLSNLQINQSYQGLLKLADSSTGITSNLQAIQDGLGNDTGFKIATNFLDSPSQITYQPLTKGFCGIGIATTGAGTANTNVNKVNGHFFFAQAGVAYTGLTISVGTITTTNDSMDFAFYSVGHSKQYGIAPKDLIMSGITAGAVEFASTGLKTIALPSPLTFPESGVYFLANLIQSSTTPTVRLRGANITQLSALSLAMAEMYGYVLDQGNAGYINPFMGSTTNTSYVLYGGTDGPFLASYDPATIGATGSSFNANTLGFVLTY